MKKKLKLGLLVLLVLICIPSFVVMANTKPKFSLSDVGDLSRGDEFTVNINLSGATAYDVITYKFTYDSNAFEYVSSTGLQDSEFLVPPANATDGSVVFNATLWPQYESSDYNGVIGSVTLKVKDSAAGESDFGLEIIDFQKRLTEGNDDVSATYEDLEYEVAGVKGVVNVPVTDISLSHEDINLLKGYSQTVTITPNPLDTTVAKNATFTPDKTGIVEIDSDGKITAIGNGTTEITVVAYGITKKINVSVTNPIKSVELSEKSLKMSKDEEKTLTATITPDDTSDSKTITWSSDDESIAKVDANGKITAISNGTTKIKATTSNGIIAECSVEVVIPMTSASISDKSLALDKGQTHTLTVSYEPLDTTEDTTVTWSSTDTSVATVSNGLVTAIGGGSATINVVIGEFSFQVPVTVKVPLDSISLSETNIELLPTQSKTLTVTYNPGDTTDDKTVTWSSDDESIAKVENGIITAVSNGTTTITAKVGEKTAEAIVKVLIPIDSVIIQPNSNIDLERKKTTTLSVSIYPADAEEDKTVKWSSSDTTIASVDESTGVVTAHKIGTAIITGTLKNGKSVTANINVIVPLESISFDKSEITVGKKTTTALKVNLNPFDTTDTTAITWDSSDKSVATVDTNGNVKALTDGTTIITANKNGYTATITVHVITPVESIVIDQNDLEIDKEKSQTLTATISPADATDKTIKWSSSNTSVATIDSNGILNAIGVGTTTITATAGAFTDTIVVTVIIPIQSFDVAQDKMTILKGAINAKNISTTINPENTTEDKTITWISDDESIAKVDANGKVTGMSKGTTTITGTLSNGMKVTVEVTVEIIELDDIEVEVSSPILKGTERTIKITPDPIDTTELENIKYTSSDKTIFTVDSNGVIKGLKAGKAILTVEVGTIKKEIEITVEEIHAKSIWVSIPSNSITVGQELQLNVTIDPENTTDELKYTYTSSDENVVKVDENGKVLGINSGTATITIKADNGLSTTVDITVANDNIVTTTAHPNTSVDSSTPYLIISLLSLISIIRVGYKRIRLG